MVRVSNNYNNLFEQPVIFYAICLAIAVLGHVDNWHIWCAWAYVITRIAHSLVQATIDIVTIRFYLFLFSWVPLMVMIIREAMSFL